MTDPVDPDAPESAAPGLADAEPGPVAETAADTGPGSSESPPASEGSQEAPQPGVPSGGDGDVSSSPEDAGSLSAPSHESPSTEAREPAPELVLSPAATKARRKDKLLGMGIILVTFLATLSLAWMTSRSTLPEQPSPPQPPSVDGLSGFPNAVDPIAVLAAARKRTPRTELRGIAMSNVKSDGTVDVSGGSGRIRYVFQSKRGQGPQPLPAGTRLRRPYCGKQTVHVKKDGLQEDPDVTKTHCPGKQSDALPDPPRCGPKEVWKWAIEKHQAPADRRARLEYYQARSGPAWRFQLPGKGRIKFELYGDCGRELKGSEKIGSVP